MDYDELPQRRLTMSLRQIEVFRAIMLTGSISEAARMLFIAQPSVSRVLAVTEERLGFPLFERTRGRLFPTPEARRLFEEVEVAYTGVQRVDELVRALMEGRSGKLNVVCSPSLGVHLLPRAIAQFNRRYRELPIHFEPLTHNNLVPRVLFGKNYLGVSMFDITHPHLESEPLAEVPLVCISPRGWLDSDAPTVRLAELRERPWIDYRHDSPLGHMLGEMFRNEPGGEPRPRPVVEVRSSMSACALVAEGVGVALVDPLCVDASMRTRIDVRPLYPERMLKVHAVYARAEPLSHSAREFLGALRAVLRESPGAR
jgi:DNA-binding transcriptional LysR family regulator